MSDSKVWTKKLVQQHTKVAAAIELYTVPFYTTVMTSIQDTDSDAYKIIQGVLVEEMMHLQLAANLCVALDTTPQLTIPNYHHYIPYLKPGVVINADMAPLTARTLEEMLAIETPEEIVDDGIEKEDPSYPYSSIGEMYNALLIGIEEKVGVDQFNWSTENQQQFWANQGYPQIIHNIEDAKEAIKAIKEQGEGRQVDPNIPTPYQPADFPVEEMYRMNNTAPGGSYEIPIVLKEYAHYGRFLEIQRHDLPEVYTGHDDPSFQPNKELKIKLAMMIGELNMFWLGDTFMSKEARWDLTLKYMREVAKLSQTCWQHGVIPEWS